MKLKAPPFQPPHLAYMKNVIYKFVKNRNRTQNIGCIAAIGYNNIGYSLCNIAAGDKFSKTVALDIALKRAHEGMIFHNINNSPSQLSKVPHSIQKPLLEFIEQRVNKYFKVNIPYVANSPLADNNYVSVSPAKGNFLTFYRRIDGGIFANDMLLISDNCAIFKDGRIDTNYRLTKASAKKRIEQGIWEEVLIPIPMGEVKKVTAPVERRFVNIQPYPKGFGRDIEYGQLKEVVINPNTKETFRVYEGGTRVKCGGYNISIKEALDYCAQKVWKEIV